jgi:hypothetical protein
VVPFGLPSTADEPAYPPIIMVAPCVRGATELRRDGWMSTAAPNNTTAAPATFVRPTPCRQFFSARNTTAMAGRLFA